MEKSLKFLIWLYVVLLIFEGALRKWVLPSLSDPLLIVRDPIAIGIYLLAFFSGRFPLNGFVLTTFALAAASIMASLIGGHTNPLVLAYGLRINYGHLPLMWVMAQVLTRKDVEKLGSFLSGIAQNLESAGAEAIVLCANTLHIVADKALHPGDECSERRPVGRA